MRSAIRFRSWCFALFLLLLVLLLPLYGSAATYYVDFQSGKDLNDGLSAASAWKRAPGDSLATAVPRQMLLRPGDTVLFKGGVTYYGSIDVNASGAVGSPITFKGNAWGSNNAILEGAAVWTPNWRHCSSAAECGGNPNYSSIYYSAAPTGYSNFTTGLWENEEFLWYAQSPNPKDFFYYDNLSDMSLIPKGSPDVVQTKTTLKDVNVFTQSDPSFWVGATILSWVIPNDTKMTTITGYNPATRTVVYNDLVNNIYTDRDSYYAILNHPFLIDTPGEYAYVASQNRIYLYPRGNPNSNNYSVSNLGTGINIDSRRYITVEGFTVTHFTFGLRVPSNTQSGDHIIFRNNTVTRLRSNEMYAVQMAASYSTVDSNSVTNCLRAVGILAGGDHTTISNNYVSRTSRQGIWFMGATNSRIVWNTIEDMRGTHSNGISVYQNSNNVLVAHNIIKNANSPLTFESTSNLTLFGNLIDSGGSGATINEWGSSLTQTNIIIVNNTLVRNGNHIALSLNGGSTPYTVVGNIIDGGGSNYRDYNLYTGLTWSQESRYGWYRNTHEISETDLSKVFVDPGSGDFRLKSASPAVGTSINPSAYLAIAAFPDYDFNVDLAKNRRPANDRWSMGAYEPATQGRPSTPATLRAQ